MICPQQMPFTFSKIQLYKKTLHIIRKKCFVSNLLGMLSKTQIITPLPDLFLSILNGSENSSTKIYKFGKESSTLFLRGPNIHHILEQFLSIVCE